MYFAINVVFLIFGKWLQETISYINVRMIIYENCSLIFLSYCFTGASRQLLFLEYFLYSFCSSLSRSSFGGAQHYRDTWYFYHTVRLSTIYVYEIAYHHNFFMLRKLHWLHISHFSSLAKTYQFFWSWERRLIRNNQFLSRNISKSKSWCMAYTSEISRDRKWGQG